MTDAVLAERRDGVVWLTLNRPEQMNALSTELIMGLARQVEIATHSTDDRVVVITGSGPAFCAGADLVEAQEKTKSSKAFRSWLVAWRDAFTSIERLPKPAIAALNGPTLAGGLELALACDVIVAADTAVIGDVHARFGLAPGGGGSRRLPEAIGTRRARWLMYTAATLSAAEAQEWGLVQSVVDHEDFNNHVHRIAAKMARRSSVSLAFMKLMSTPSSITREALDLEIDEAARLIVGDDAQEGIAAFLGKREPNFAGAPARRTSMA